MEQEVLDELQSIRGAIENADEANREKLQSLSQKLGEIVDELRSLRLDVNLK